LLEAKWWGTGGSGAERGIHRVCELLSSLVEESHKSRPGPIAAHNEADPLIEGFIVACLDFEAFRVMGGVTAKPACGLCAIR